MANKCCLNCPRRDVPACYADCPDYKKLQEEFAAKRAYLTDAAHRQKNFDAAHVDLAKKGRHR